MILRLNPGSPAWLAACREPTLKPAPSHPSDCPNAEPRMPQDASKGPKALGNGKNAPRGLKSTKPHENHTEPQLPDTQPKHDPKPALDGMEAGKNGGVPRVVVRFTGYRVRPLDPDNFAGSVKDCIDGLRHCHLIAGDEPWRIRLETEQVRVRTFKEEKTVIEIEYPVVYQFESNSSI